MPLTPLKLQFIFTLWWWQINILNGWCLCRNIIALKAFIPMPKHCVCDISRLLQPRVIKALLLRFFLVINNKCKFLLMLKSTPTFKVYTCQVLFNQKHYNTCNAFLPTDIEFCILFVWANTSFCRALCWAAKDLL